MLMQSSFTTFCLLQKAVMYAAQDFVFISPLTMDPGTKCWHGGDGGGDLWWLDGDFFIYNVFYKNSCALQCLSVELLLKGKRRYILACD